MSSTDRLSEIQERLAKATPGPWKQYSGHVGNLAGYVCAAAEPSGRYVPADFKPVDLSSERFEEAVANAALIANAPADLQFLLSLVDELRKDAARLTFLEEKCSWAYCEDRPPTPDACIDPVYLKAAKDAGLNVEDYSTVVSAHHRFSTHGLPLPLRESLDRSIRGELEAASSAEAQLAENDSADSVSSPMTGNG